MATDLKLPNSQASQLNRLETFLARDVHSHSRLLAKTVGGELVLYEKPKPEGFKAKLGDLFDRMIGRTDRREQKARTAILDIVSDVLNNNKTDESALLGKNILNVLGGHKGPMRASFFSAIVLAARNLPAPTDMPPVTAGGPTLASLGIKTDDPEIVAAAALLASGPGNEQQALGKLTNLILQKFTAQNGALTDDKAKQADAKAFALSDGIKLASDLKSALLANLKAKNPAASENDVPGVKALVTAFTKVASEITTDKVAPGATTPIKVESGATLQMQNLIIAGVEYKPVSAIGEGGFANVFKYVAVNDDTKAIAVKVTKSLGNVDEKDLGGYAATIQSAGEEISSHENAVGDGCKQIVGIEGWVRMPDGNIAVAMELAPLGTAFELGVQLNDMVKSGALSRDEANVLMLTMLKDMISGLKHLHDTQGVTHLDFKAVNCFIGADGTVKIGDFGTAMVTDGTARLIDAARIDNPNYKAPELHRGEAQKKALRDETAKRTDRATKPFTEKLNAIFPKNARKLVATLARNAFATPVEVIEQKERMAAARITFDRKVDIFGLGSSALEMLTGNAVGFFTTFWSEMEETLASYGSNPDNEPLSDPQPPDGRPAKGSVGIKTGNPLLDGLLTKMLKPNPDDRASAAQLLSDPALQARNGIDSKEARDLIVAIKSSDPTKILAARKALSDEVKRSADEQEMDEIKGIVSDAETAIDNINDLLESMEIQNIVDDAETAIDDINEELKFLDTSPVPDEESSTEAKQRDDVPEDSGIGSDTSTNTVSGSSTPDEFDTIATQMKDDLKALDDLMAETEMPELPETPAPETAPTPNEVKDQTTPNSGRPLPTPPVGPRNGQ